MKRPSSVLYVGYNACDCQQYAGPPIIRSHINVIDHYPHYIIDPHTLHTLYSSSSPVLSFPRSASTPPASGFIHPVMFE